MEPKVLMILMVAIHKADGDPSGNRSLRRRLGEAALRLPTEITELDNHVHTDVYQLID